MAFSQPCQQSTSSSHKTNHYYVAEAVQRGEFTLSISNMLGCDYIFVSHTGNHELLAPTHLATTIRELLEILETSPHQSTVISVDETLSGDLAFTRHDYKWENRQVVDVICSRVTNIEQIDFIQMMFDCSTSC